MRQESHRSRTRPGRAQSWSRAPTTMYAHGEKFVHSADLSNGGVNRLSVAAEGNRTCDSGRRSGDRQRPEHRAIGSVDRDQLSIHAKGENGPENNHATVGRDSWGHGKVSPRDPIGCPISVPLGNGKLNAQSRDPSGL